MFFIIVRLYMFFKSLITLKNYTIKRACLEYISPATKSFGWNKFWRKEERDWDEDEDYHYTNVTWEMGRIGRPPDCIKNQIMRIEYEYDGKDYECVTTNTEIEWPPKESKDAVFSLPINKVMLLDEHGAPVRDVTDELKPMMGPRKDFHGEDVLVEDLFSWDDYINVEITNALNVSKVVGRMSSCLQLL
jgi:hypothetical protein